MTDFGRLVRAEWTKFRTVRGWLIGAVVAVLLMILLAVLTGAGSKSTVGATPDNPQGRVGHPYVPIGPDGEAVVDQFYFLHQQLGADGSLTARVGPLTGGTLQPTGPAGSGLKATFTPGDVQGWAKAGLIIKADTKQGSAYAAIMVTGSHGVRMQYNYTGDVAGPADARWVRLTRSGADVTGWASTDGQTWTKVGSAHLAGLPTNAPAGMFVASPTANTFTQNFGGGSGTGSATAATATFDALDVHGQSGTGWTASDVRANDGPPVNGSYQPTGAGYTVTGSGDIAPDVGYVGDTIDHTLTGGFAALAVMVVLGVLFITTEYRRGLIRTSLTATPRRGRVLAAKAVVIGAVTFVTGLVAAFLSVPIGEHLLRQNGNFVYPVSGLTWVRIVVGTAAVLAVAAVLALAIGTMLRRSAGAVAAVVVLVVLPYLLATAGVLPGGPAQWVMRLTPAAGFALQQSIPAYPQVDHSYIPLLGFYPLPPWGGFAVLCAWTAVALAGAGYLLRRRDA
jgi:hypothetical protein